MLEGAIAFSFLIISFFFGLGLVQVAYESYYTEHALRRTVRWAQTGEQFTWDSDAEIIERIRNSFVDNARVYGLTVDSEQLRICNFNAPNCQTDTLGTSGSLFFLSYRYTTNILSTRLYMDFDLEVMGRNENY